MASLREKVDDLNNRILQGDILGAFDEYYHDDVTMTDAGQEPRVGKPANREFEEMFVNGLTEFRGAKIYGSGVDEENNKSYTEWHFDYSHSSFGDQKYDQVAVQTWKDGKIIDEKFYKMAI